ncbi:MAG: hypothetical protein CML16_14125 [Pusillimonas sp.]|nr:hypothetical protein [Pusillimonas sp.]MBC43464.1 hypothetical protein [Pusillimonas sp.]HCP78478.1 hypothetical protein [Pusillimonas sp.]|tara:strand:+ start:303 stop:1157 length:855 start_codon:yes stop_codon:yes gene_type:complete
MKVLITGATGGLARSVISEFKSAGYSITLTGRQNHNARNYIPCNLTDADAVTNLVCNVKPNLVLHLAGSFENNLAKDIAVNSLSAAHIAEALLKNDNNARLVLIGSAAEYGQVSPDENPIAEDHPLRPVSVYGLTKTMQTNIGLFYAASRKLDIVIARIFNICGDGFSERLFVGRATRQIDEYKQGQIKELVFGNLTAKRDYITAKKAAMLLKLVAEKGENGTVYNIGEGQPIQMLNLLQKMLDDANISNAPIVQQTVGNRPAVIDIPSIYADISRVEELLQNN